MLFDPPERDAWRHPCQQNRDLDRQRLKAHMAINPHVFAFLMLLAVPGMFIFAYALIAAVGWIAVGVRALFMGLTVRR